MPMVWFTRYHFISSLSHNFKPKFEGFYEVMAHESAANCTTTGTFYFRPKGTSRFGTNFWLPLHKLTLGKYN